MLGHLLIRGIPAYKSYQNFRGYDLIATNPEKGRSCRIQVKSRWATDYDGGFPVKSFDCEFVVHVALNRGFRYRKRGTAGSGIRAPDYYVLPVAEAKKGQDPRSEWGKVFLRRIPSAQRYLGNWGLIHRHLGYAAGKRVQEGDSSTH